MTKAAYRTADATVAAYDAVAVTKSDTTDINTTRSLYVGTGGTLQVTMAYGSTVTFTGVPNGTILPIQVTRVWASGSSAADILALY